MHKYQHGSILNVCSKPHVCSKLFQKIKFKILVRCLIKTKNSFDEKLVSDLFHIKFKSRSTLIFIRIFLSVLSFYSVKSDDFLKKQTVFAKKRPHENEVHEPNILRTVLSDYRIESSKMVNTCHCCFQTIKIDHVRILKVVSTIQFWYHAKCFAKHSLTLGWNEMVEHFPGFTKLSPDDQKAMEILFPYVITFYSFRHLSF